MKYQKSQREKILSQITRLQKNLSELQSEQAKIKSQIDSLHAQLNNHYPDHQICQHKSVSLSNYSVGQKIDIFQQLFNGRSDVFPKQWINKKSGKKGYSPVCNNEWAKGICEKPKIKCTDCAHQAFAPLTQKVLLQHLRGEQIIGIYPLLPDSTCWFVAVDFDKSQWKEDVLAFVQTCKSMNVPCSIEISQSGNGAHVWIFFSAPIQAATARNLGSALITETMSRHHQLSMSSYDRLFPNQNTIPKGGFGNLIALPLQFQSRQAGNTLFLDEALTPYSDQWHYLASIERTSLMRIQDILSQATNLEGLLGENDPHPNKDSLIPSTQINIGNPQSLIGADIIPTTVNCVFSNRLVIETKELPSALITEIKRIAAFQNPEFYKKQRLRLSTALTPRIISCAELHPNHISLPRGCLRELKKLIAHHGSLLKINDMRYTGDPVELKFHGRLSERQQIAAYTILQSENGIIVAPPGFGKTVLGTYLVAKRNCNTLILVHRQPLLNQWRSQLALFLDIKPKLVGQYGSGKRNLTGQVDVAMIQSLSKKGKVDELISEYEQIIVDECHHISAVSFERVLSEANARYVVGLTATPTRRDGLHPIIHMQIGPIQFKETIRNQLKQQNIHHKLIIRKTDFQLPDKKEYSIHEVYKKLAHDKKRNEQIFNDVIESLEEARCPIVLTERTEHLEVLHKSFKNFVKHLIVLKGGSAVRQRKVLNEKMISIPDNEERLILATGRFIGEGFDDPRLDTLLLVMPVSWKGTIVQYAGRLHRQHAGKTEVKIIDYVDERIPMLTKMFEKRLVGYRSMGYQTSEPKDDLFE